jgi:hypothetical protein
MTNIWFIIAAISLATLAYFAGYLMGSIDTHEEFYKGQ